MSNRLAPLVGQIVRAWFPESHAIHEPGPKPRPVLILQADDTGLLCAPGTSKIKQTRYLGEIVVSPDEQPGLERTTKFALSKRLWLPARPEYFLINTRIELIGEISNATAHKLYAEMRHMGLT